MADQQDPVFQIQRVYLKEASLEQPNSPADPAGAGAAGTVDIQLGCGRHPGGRGVFEVCGDRHRANQDWDKTVFLVECKQAGIFEIRNLPPEQMGPIMGIACPQIVYPYLRGNVADMITAPASRPCTCRKSTSRPCTSSSRPTRPVPQAACHSKFQLKRHLPALLIWLSRRYENHSFGAGAWGTALASAPRLPAMP
jgi:preprotein translocase subunit SecB